MASTKPSSQLLQQLTHNNLIETLGKDAGDFGKDFKNQVKTNVKGAGIDAITQVIGKNEIVARRKSQSEVEMQAGQEFDLTVQQQTEAPKIERKNSAPGIGYHAEIARSSERSQTRESREITLKLQEITEELERIASSTDRIIKMQFKDIGTGMAPSTPGKYHLNYFTWLLTVIRSARQQVEDSGAWLQVAKRKGGVINTAWKKGNTSVTMSNERSVATQTG